MRGGGNTRKGIMRGRVEENMSRRRKEGAKQGRPNRKRRGSTEEWGKGRRKGAAQEKKNE